MTEDDGTDDNAATKRNGDLGRKKYIKKMSREKRKNIQKRSESKIRSGLYRSILIDRYILFRYFLCSVHDPSLYVNFFRYIL